MKRFEQFLLTCIGLDASSLGTQVLERIIQERRLATRSPDRDAYWQLLQRSTAEQKALIEAVVVPETWFFRDPEALLALAMLARRRLLQIRPDQGLRLLSLPCSSGEEPYSMAMALLDTGIAAQRSTRRAAASMAATHSVAARSTTAHAISPPRITTATASMTRCVPVLNCARAICLMPACWPQPDLMILFFAAMC